MPRRRPPVEIFTFPIPSELSNRQARCPQCGGLGEAIGQVGARLVYRCTDCQVRFKAPGPDDVTSLYRR